jgi:hypothetical protein
MLDRCEEILRRTGRSLLCWLRSTKPDTCYPKLFTPVALEVSKKKYRQLFKRFVAFKFRAFYMPPDLRRQLTGIRFTKKQLQQLEVMWEHKAWGEVDFARGICPATAQGAGRIEGPREDNGEGKDDGEDDTDDNGEEDDEELNEDDGDYGDIDDAGLSESDLEEGVHSGDEGEVASCGQPGTEEESSDAVNQLLELLF